MDAEHATGSPGLFKQLEGQRLVGLFVLGWLLFGYPFMGLWDQPLSVAGLPLLPLALFGSWAALIAVLAWLMERSDAAAHGDGDG